MLSHIFFRKLLHLPVSHLSQLGRRGIFHGVVLPEGVVLPDFSRPGNELFDARKEEPRIWGVGFFSCFVRREN